MDATEQAALADLIDRHFGPGTPGGECSRMTTEEIKGALDTIAPDRFFTEDIYYYLQERKYGTQLVGDTLYWLVVRG